MSRPTRPPGGWPPPESVPLAGRELALRPLAEAVAERYFAELPEDLERHGDAARAWEVHDTLCTLQWAVLDTQGLADLRREIRWLAGVLAARGFALDHLSRNLVLAAEVVEARVPDGARVGERLRAAAADVDAGYGAGGPA